MSNQTANNNLNYLTDHTFSNVNRLFVLSFENEEDRTFLSIYYVPKVEIKDYNVMIDGKPFFEIPVKNKEETFFHKILQLLYKNGKSKDNKFIDIDINNDIEPQKFTIKKWYIIIDQNKETIWQRS